MKNNKGITLIELIVAMAIASILMVVAYSMFGVGLESHKVVVNEFTEQSGIRYSISTINTALRFSTVGFAVTEDDFKPVYVNSSGTEAVSVDDAVDVTGLVKPWSYVGLSPNEDAFIYYEWVDDDLNDDSNEGIYNINVLAEAPEGVEYDITFKKGDKEDENNLVNYTLKGFKNAKETFSVQTELEALNALQIIDWGDSINRSVAFAYRTEETPEITERPVAALAMVIDESGSMNRGMDGTNTINEDNPRRVTLLQDTLNKDVGGLFSILEESESYVSLIPFDFSADDPEPYYKVKDSRTILEDLVDELNPGGYTNTGDGMRRAFYRMKEFNDDPPSGVASDQIKKNYVVILVDGATNRATYDGNGINDFYEGDGNISDLPKVYYDGDSVDPFYIDVIGPMIELIVEKSFVIGYSNRSSDLTGVDNIAESLGITVGSDEYNNSVFIATDKESLSNAFEIIGNYIKEDLWQVSGPKLP